MRHLAATLVVSMTTLGGGCGSVADEPDAGPVLPSPPQLLSRTPAPDSANVHTFAPIVLEFSEALDPSTVDDAIALAADGSPLAAKVALSEDGRTISAVLETAPSLPATVTIDVADTLRDAEGDAFAGDSWSYSLPFWFQLGVVTGADNEARERVVATSPDGVVTVVWIEETPASLRSVLAAQWIDGAWVPAGDDLAVDRGAMPREPSITHDSEGMPVVCWIENGEVYAARFDGTEWALLGDSIVREDASSAAIVADDNGDLLVAVAAGTSLRVRRWSGDGPLWTVEGSALLSVGGPTELSAVFADTLIVAFEEPSIDIRTASFSAGTWTELGRLDRLAGTSRDPQLAVDGDGNVVAAFYEFGGTTLHAYASQLDAGVWSPLGEALDVDWFAPSQNPRVAATPDGDLVFTWRERSGAVLADAFVARWSGTDIVPLGPTPNPGQSTGHPAIAADVRGAPVVLWGGQAGNPGPLRGAVFNGSPTAPPSLTPPAPTECTFPPDGAPAFPQTLDDTGCYDDVATRAPGPGMIPYDVRSPLWSDGALKQRYIALPDGQSLGYTDAGAWDVPTGTVLVKEFYYDKDGVVSPAETRFLVKRCEEGACETPWQGYSYQWDAEGTGATLLPGATSTTGRFAGQDHVFPSRAECVRCHNAAAGRVLSLHTAQLNGSYYYAGVVDNQLLALAAAGVLSGAPATPPAQQPRLPRPADPSPTVQARVRSYLHSNCAQCHRPGGERPATDFRFETSLDATGLCGSSIVVPGDASASRLWDKISVRPPDTPALGGSSMPPLATLLVDDDIVVTVASWISNLSSCP